MLKRNRMLYLAKFYDRRAEVAMCPLAYQLSGIYPLLFCTLFAKDKKKQKNKK